ncbi:DUF4190 domain-containing protein [Streptomyces sp. NPDC018833]|uniref:DUF4190 domain-containing protein n=1 Tax=Streptomyces sp. NPDC018833 TaxID=3365053 RepID=UPI00378E5711
MSDNQGNHGGPAGAPQPNDPWAPPAGGAPQDKVPLDKPQSAPTPPSVHEQQTVIGMPIAGPGDTGSAPPPPVAPGGPAPAAGAYGYPAAPSLPQPPASGGFGAPSEGFGAPSDPYGAAYPGYAPYAGPTPGWTQTPANGMGITAMVLGILSVCLFCLYGIVGIILGVLALIFGILGRKRAQRGEATNGGMALSGIILGSIGIALGLIFIALLAWGITTAINEDRKNKDDYDYDYDSYSNHLVVDDTRR